MTDLVVTLAPPTSEHGRGIAPSRGNRLSRDDASFECSTTATGRQRQQLVVWSGVTAVWGALAAPVSPTRGARRYRDANEQFEESVAADSWERTTHRRGPAVSHASGSDDAHDDVNTASATRLTTALVAAAGHVEVSVLLLVRRFLRSPSACSVPNRLLVVSRRSHSSLWR
ncbi:hypothetical protein C8039_09785 [Halogeometricum sp. wsp3]|nr:hypothetical protein C8039_09785 [Halogeometricum sp. wsp3]